MIRGTRGTLLALALAVLVGACSKENEVANKDSVAKATAMAPESVRVVPGGPKHATQDSALVLLFSRRMARALAESVRRAPGAPRGAQRESMAAADSAAFDTRVQKLVIKFADSVRIVLPPPPPHINDPLTSKRSP